MPFCFPNKCCAIEPKGIRCVRSVSVKAFHRGLKNYRLDMLKHRGEIHWQFHRDVYFI